MADPMLFEMSYAERLERAATSILGSLVSRYSSTTNLSLTQQDANVKVAVSLAKKLVDAVAKEPIR